MKAPWRLLLTGLAAAMLLWGCTGPSSPVVPIRREIAAGDRQMDWALVYYQSWRRAGDEQYLRLARRQMARAVRTYFDLQVKMGHSFPDFYIVDRKRRRGCRFIDQMEREASRFRVPLQVPELGGCL